MSNEIPISINGQQINLTPEQVNQLVQTMLQNRDDAGDEEAEPSETEHLWAAFDQLLESHRQICQAFYTLLHRRN